MTLDSFHLPVYSYTKGMHRSLAPPVSYLCYNRTLTENTGCTWEYADSQTMNYRGVDGQIDNNLWHHNDFSCIGDGNLFQSKGVRDRFVHSVVHNNRPSIGFGPGNIQEAAEKRTRQLEA